jgi:3-hydroxyacyl-CoA dehydrogenase
MGRPKSAVFRTADVVGLDTLAHVLTTVREGAEGDPWRDRFAVPDVIARLVEDGRLGAKTKAGFYRKAGKDILALDLDTLEYVEQPKVRFDSMGASRNLETAAEKVAAMVWFDDPAGNIAWKVTAETSLYAASLIGEIADDVVNIDRALRWGFNYEMGPFQTWDAIGVERSVERMRAEGMEIPAVVETMLAESEGAWYVRRDGAEYYWDVASREYRPVPVAERLVLLTSLAERDTVINRNDSATLYDMGDGVGCVEFHTKMNSLDGGIVEIIDDAVRRVNEGELVGLVVGNEAENFSVGANIGLVAMAATGGQWDMLEQALAGMQNAFMGMKYCRGPVVIAPRGMALGGGCECVMHGASVRASAETYMGLVEVGVGLIPGAGGCKEMAFRFYGSVPAGVEADLHPLARRLFRIIGTATVGTSAEESRDLGFLRPADRVTLNPDAVLADAKDDVLGLVKMGYAPPRPTRVAVPGSGGIAALKIGAHGMQQGGYISEYDEHIAGKLASVLCGGDVPEGTLRSEQELLDLEREAFLSLCGEEKTIARIMHMLQTGKPLRN